MNRLLKAPHGRRLFVAHRLDGRTFVLAASLREAFTLDAGVRPVSDEEVSEFLAEFATGTTGETCRALDVSRQTLHLWRKRAGVPAPPVSVSRRIEPESVVALLRGGASVEETAARSRCHVSTVRRMAREAGVALPPRPEYPPDAELLALAAGRTWQELAAALGRRTTAARAYVYARPELARALRAVMARKAPGRSSDAQ